MKLPDWFHKDLLDNIIHRGALEFIKNDKDGHQEEEEYPNNFSLMSSDKEEEEGSKSEYEDDYKYKLK